ISSLAITETAAAAPATTVAGLRCRVNPELCPDEAGILGAAVLVSRSTDGGLTWGNPVAVATASGNQNLDKNWTACDNTPSSPFYGHCYTEFDDNGAGDRIKMS